MRFRNRSRMTWSVDLEYYVNPPLRYQCDHLVEFESTYSSGVTDDLLDIGFGEGLLLTVCSCSREFRVRGEVQRPGVRVRDVPAL